MFLYLYFTVMLNGSLFFYTSILLTCLIILYVFIPLFYSYAWWSSMFLYLYFTVMLNDPLFCIPLLMNVKEERRLEPIRAVLDDYQPDYLGRSIQGVMSPEVNIHLSIILSIILSIYLSLYLTINLITWEDLSRE